MSTRYENSCCYSFFVFFFFTFLKQNLAKLILDLLLHTVCMHEPIADTLVMKYWQKLAMETLQVPLHVHNVWQHLLWDLMGLWVASVVPVNPSNFLQNDSIWHTSHAISICQTATDNPFCNSRNKHKSWATAWTEKLLWTWSETNDCTFCYASCCN